MSNEYTCIKDNLVFETKGVTPKYVVHSDTIVLNQKCVRNGIIDYSFSQFISGKQNISPEKYVKLGDVLLNSTGQGTAGRCAFVEHIPGDYKVTVDSHMLILRFKNKELARYFAYSLYEQEKFIQGLLTGSSGQGELDREIVYGIHFPFRKSNLIYFDNLLITLNKKIELNNKINEELEKIAKTLYDYWFVQFDFPDENNRPYKSSGGAMVYNEELKREIPKGWECHNLSNLYSYTRGVTYNKSVAKDYPLNGYTPIFRANNISSNRFNYESLVYVPSDFVSRNQILKENDVVITMSSGSKEHIGKVAIATGKLGYSYGAFCAKLSPNKDFDHLLHSIVIGNIFKAYIRQICIGTNINNLTIENISDFKIPRIPKNILFKFNETISHIRKKLSNLQEENIKLSELRDFLLPMLMNGQVKVI